MAGSFPTLRSGQTVFYPVVDIRSFATGMHRFMDDTEQRWRGRLMLVRYELVFSNINSYDVSKIRNFFRSQFGRFDDTWSLTVGSEVWTDLAFDQDEFPPVEEKRNHFTFQLKILQVKSSNPTIPAATPYFPQINSQGVTAQLPYASRLEYRTSSEELPTGRRYAYKWRANPLGYFEVALPNITDVELTKLKDFFYSMEGRRGEFTFLDPGGNLANYSDDFGQASWTKTDLTAGAAVADPFGGTDARAITGTLTNGLLYTTVLPSGNASGYVLCGSVWAKALSAGQSLSIGFIDSGFSVLSNTIWTLPQNQWVRIYHTITLATASYIRLLIGGFSTWGATTIHLFSGQVSPTPGPNGRLLTPGADALRAKCRFDNDDFRFSRNGVNHSSVAVPIREYI